VGAEGADDAAQESPTVRQYELRWASLPAPIGRRPVLLLTRTPAFAYLNKVIVAEITTTIRRIPQEVMLGPAEGLARASVANLDNIHVILKSIVGDRIGRVERSREREVKRALGYALDWIELKVL
jgi:mRNA interferase MazF